MRGLRGQSVQKCSRRVHNDLLCFHGVQALQIGTQAGASALASISAAMVEVTVVASEPADWTSA